MSPRAPTKKGAEAMKVVSIGVPEGLDEKDVRLAIVIEAVRRGLISVDKAAESAGLPL